MNERELSKKNNSAEHFRGCAENGTFFSPAGLTAGSTTGLPAGPQAGLQADSTTGTPAGTPAGSQADSPTGTPAGTPAGSQAPRPGQVRRAQRLRCELAVLAGLLLALFLSNFTGFASACAAVRADTLRLHILANSDSEADQALKLAVRDAILAEAGGLFAAGQTKQEALDAARQSLPMLQMIAEETLRAHGCGDAVSVRLEELYFNTREYEDFTLPAGRYDAVRIEIGAHEGKNWFCVLFPPLCLPAASDIDASGADMSGADAFGTDTFGMNASNRDTSGRNTSGRDASNEGAPAYSEAEQNAIHSPYRIRFAAVELIEGWKEALRQSSASPEAAASQGSTPENSTPESGVPEDSVPESGTAASGMRFEK